MMWMVLALTMFSLVAVTGREAGTAIAEAAGRTSPEFGDTLQIMLVRSIVGVIVITLVIALSSNPAQHYRFHKKPLHIARNVGHFIAQFCWFHALGLITLSQLFALEFTSPLWVALFAWALLGEQFTRLRAAAVACGFIGMLVIVQPQNLSLSVGSGFALTAAVGFALSMIATKRLMATESALSVLFHMSWIQLVAALIFATPFVVLQSAETYAWMIGVGLTSLGAHFALANAFREGDAMIVAPMDFLRLPIIAAIGALAYNETIAPEVAIGAALILFGNFLNLWGQRSKRA